MQAFRDCLGSSLRGALLSGDRGFAGNWLWSLLASQECGFMFICNSSSKCGHPFTGAAWKGASKYPPAFHIPHSKRLGDAMYTATKDIPFGHNKQKTKLFAYAVRTASRKNDPKKGDEVQVLRIISSNTGMDDLLASTYVLVSRFQLDVAGMITAGVVTSSSSPCRVSFVIVRVRRLVILIIFIIVVIIVLVFAAAAAAVVAAAVVLGHPPLQVRVVPAAAAVEPRSVPHALLPSHRRGTTANVHGPPEDRATTPPPRDPHDNRASGCGVGPPAYNNRHGYHCAMDSGT